MAKGMPSLAALLGLVAVAGYQNREKIGDFIKGLDDPTSPARGNGGAGKARYNWKIWPIFGMWADGIRENDDGAGGLAVLKYWGHEYNEY